MGRCTYRTCRYVSSVQLSDRVDFPDTAHGSVRGQYCVARGAIAAHTRMPRTQNHRATVGNTFKTCRDVLLTCRSALRFVQESCPTSPPQPSEEQPDGFPMHIDHSNYNIKKYERLHLQIERYPAVRNSKACFAQMQKVLGAVRGTQLGTYFDQLKRYVEDSVGATNARLLDLHS